MMEKSFFELLLHTGSAAAAMAVVLVLTARGHGRFTMDLPGAVQKFHRAPTPRIGGVAIYLAAAVAWAGAGGEAQQLLAMLWLAGMPAFLVGLVEDVTKRVSVRARLLITISSGALVVVGSGVALVRTGMPLVDVLFSFWPFAFLFTAFAVGGMANAINIIDGFHGLASGMVILSLLAIASIAQGEGDVELVMVASLVAAAVTGFWLLNFPWGKLFLGDGGAYFCGFAMGWLTVQLLMRNPAVSIWSGLLVCAYPTIEVLYSVLRRRKRRRSPGAADGEHLHSLVFTRMVQPHLHGLPADLRNAAVSVVIWLCAATPLLLAVVFPRRGELLFVTFTACVCAYHLFYRWLATASVPARCARR